MLIASVTHSNCPTLFARGDKALELYKEATHSPSENDKLSFNPQVCLPYWEELKFFIP